VADFRAPDIVRLGPGPLPGTVAESATGIRRLADAVRSGAYADLPDAPGRVT
jgi:kynureninase